jgi:hypothetical protein
MNGESWDDRNMTASEADLTPETLEEMGFPARIVDKQVVPRVAHMLFRLFSHTLRIQKCSWLESIASVMHAIQIFVSLL